MIADLVIGALIFSYAAWTLYRFVKKSKQGKCTACALKDGCPSNKRG
ncbi:MAG TPA: FeoB-associated Cys-rich membrane protein [Paenibacillaceae bacterium]|nr:FeoB-associated Cys-rich membrane protein [Paenibacillaceae bacterium]